MNYLLLNVILVLACWGSFLNFLAYRLVHDLPFSKQRSLCPHCHYQIAWYDLVPILSWLNLKGRCRNCKKSISILYLLIELLTIILGLLVFYLISPSCWLATFILFSALLITIRTDLETLLISRFVTLFLIPVPIVLSLVNLKPQALLCVNLTQALSGAGFGYLILFLINQIFKLCTKKEGIGQGDMELLALIGAFTGVYGVWMTLTLGSILGSLIGLLLIGINQLNRQTKLPFGPFLAISAILYVLFQNQLLKIFVLF